MMNMIMGGGESEASVMVVERVAKHGNISVRPVNLIKVEVICLKPPEAPLYCLRDVVAIHARRT